MQLVDVAHSLDQATYPDLDTLQASYGWGKQTHRIFSRMFRLKSTSLHPDMTLLQGLTLSAKALAKRNPALMGSVDYLIYAHALNTSLPCDDVALSDLARDVFDSDPEVMSVTHGSCASAIMAMELMRKSHDGKAANVVLLTGEKCFFELLDYADNNGLFGETTSASLLKLGADGDGAKIAAVSTGMFDGVYKPLGKADKDTLAKYDQAFIPRISAAVASVLDEAGIAPDDVGLVLPTHLSPFTFNRVAAQVGIDGDKVRKQNLDRIGHCFCGDLFINYQTWCDAVPDDGAPTHILSFAAGMTGSYAAIVLTKDPVS